MGRVAKDGVQLPTEDMNLDVLRRAIAAAAEAQTEVKQARGSKRAMKKNAESQLHLYINLMLSNREAYQQR